MDDSGEGKDGIYVCNVQDMDILVLDVLTSKRRFREGAR